jgi:hypothetical protein
MYLQDLSEYTYEQIRPVPGVLAVGWLARGHDFPVGKLPAHLLAKVEYLIARLPMNRMRGWHVCHLCFPNLDQVQDLATMRTMLSGWPPVISTPHGECQLGSAEIWVPGRDGIAYAAPNLIHHYITQHDYLPPAPFVTALENFDPARGWDPEADYERRIRAAH